MKCARTSCDNEGKHHHLHLSGLYCMPCGRRINDANGVNLVDIQTESRMIVMGKEQHRIMLFSIHAAFEQLSEEERAEIRPWYTAQLKTI